jgi:transcriptional regulator with XRE-family HTH domain
MEELMQHKDKQNKYPSDNRLDYFRRQRRFTTSYIAMLLGHKDTSTYCDYERGDRLPSLVNAFRLSAILRTPVEFLFPSLYDDLRDVIRAEEEHLNTPTQAMLF